MKPITTYISKKKQYTIVKKNGKYLAIDHKYLDSNGCLTQTLNGLQMKASDTLKRCIELCEMEAKIEEYESQGYSRIIATGLASGMTLEQCVEWENKCKEAGIELN